jgi:hypothetical protein
MATNVKILLRRGARSEISADTLSTGEMGFADDTNQLYVGIDAAIDELVFDPFANAHAVVQSYLDTYTAETGLVIDEDLIIRNVSDVDALLLDMATNGTFNVHQFGRARRNVEVLTENSFSQAYAGMHLQSHTAASGLRSDLFKKELNVTVAPITAGSFVVDKQYKILSAGTTDFTLIGAADSNVGTVFTTTGVGAGTGTARLIATFLKYTAADCTSFFIDYSLKQVGSTITFVRVGTLQIINGVPQSINLTNITDTNTEIHQDLNTDTIVDPNEISNIEFTAVIDGTDIKVNYTQDVNFTTEISYTVKRWTM